MARRKLTDEEKKRRKRYCERRRRQNIKNNPERYKVEQEKKHQRYEKAKETGIVRLKKDLSRRELKAKRKAWKINSKHYRDRKQFLINLEKNTPPSSDHEEVEQDQENREPIVPNINIVGNASTSSITTPDVSFCTPSSSRQKRQGRKVVKRNRSKMYRELKKAQSQNSNLRTKMEYYKKKFYREINKNKNVLSPNTEVNKMLKSSPKIPQVVKRKLLFGEVLKRDLSAKFKKLKGDKEKQIFTKIVEGANLKKYKLIKEAKEFLPPGLHRSNKKRSNSFKYERKPINTFTDTKKVVTSFFLNDINSRLCPGKKDTITRRCIKKQKRYLNNTLKNLFSTFKTEHSSIQISYATFCKLRPFWVVQPKLTDRDTCLCVLHENVNLLVSSLSRSKIIKEQNVDQIVSKQICSNNEVCLERMCGNCRGNRILYYVEDEMWTQTIRYDKWVNRKEKRISAKTKKEITVQLTEKQKIEAKPDHLIHELDSLMTKFLRHIMSINHQYAAMKKIKNELKEDEILFHIDFSENYSCKYSKETQSVHFGASREQITLHTGMMYHKNKKQGFCTVSKSLRHDPSAIMAHMEPVINHYQNEIETTISVVHFLSDSPSTQYRNKKMFFFIQSVIPKTFPNIKKISWNYSEAGHGKGAPDGIGATLKRTADKMVAFNKDINNFNVFVQAVKDNITSLYINVVDDASIKKFDDYLPLDLITLKGTMQTHQVTWQKDSGILFLNKLSCFECNFSDCSHYKITNTPQEDTDKTTVIDESFHNVDLKENDWVTAIFDNDWYPGIIDKIEHDELSVNFMSKSGKSFFWPDSCDRQTLKITGILSKLEVPPEPVSNRLFKLKNYNQINDLFQAFL